MREHGNQPEISLERNLESRRLSIDLALRRCQRKDWQPRDYFLGVTEQMEQVPETKHVAQEIRQQLQLLPDIDWKHTDREELGDMLFNIAKPLLLTEYEQGRSIISSGENWKSAGVFAYEIYDSTAEPAMPELGTEPLMIIHLPSQAESIKRETLLALLKELATTLTEHPDVKGIRGTSLLLEHPLFQRLGFQIDKEHDTGPMASTFISREEFIERFGN